MPQEPKLGEFQRFPTPPVGPGDPQSMCGPTSDSFPQAEALGLHQFELAIAEDWFSKLSKKKQSEDHPLEGS